MEGKGGDWSGSDRNGWEGYPYTEITFKVWGLVEERNGEEWSGVVSNGMDGKGIPSREIMFKLEGPVREWTGLDRMGAERIGADWSGEDRTGKDWIGKVSSPWDRYGGFIGEIPFFRLPSLYCIVSISSFVLFLECKMRDVPCYWNEGILEECWRGAYVRQLPSSRLLSVNSLYAFFGTFLAWCRGLHYHGCMIEVITANKILGSTIGGTSIGVTHTAIAGPARSIFAFCAMNGSGDTVSSIDYAGTAMRFVTSLESATPSARLEIWTLSDEVDGYNAIPVAANSVSVIFSDTTGGAVQVVQVNGVSPMVMDTDSHVEDGATVYTGSVDVGLEDSIVFGFFVNIGQVNSVTPNDGQATLYSGYIIPIDLWFVVLYKIVDRGTVEQGITCSLSANRGTYYIWSHEAFRSGGLARFGG